MARPDKKIKKNIVEEFSAIVADGMYRDNNLGVVPLTKTIQKKLKVLPGDIIELSFSGKKTVATVIEGYNKDSKSNYVRLDKRTRDQLGIILGEEITLTKPQVFNANEVIVRPKGKIPHTIPVPIDWQTYFRQRLVNKGVIEGDKISMPVLGVNIEFDVVNVQPLGVCKVTSETTFDFSENRQACC